MKTLRLKQILKFLTWMTLLLLGLTACLQGGNTENGEVLEYNGIGLRPSLSQTNMVSGRVKYANFTGGEIMVEARYSVPCEFGRCPVVGQPPVASIVLDSPRMYVLQLPIPAQNLLIIASMMTPDTKVRIASSWVLGEETVYKNIDLDLNEISPPLR